MHDLLDERAGEIAARQHGLITRRQALEVGFTPGTIQTRRRSGQWETADIRVYRLRGAPLTWKSRVLALCLALGGVASHRTAAALQRVDGFLPTIIEISVPYGRSVPRAGVVIHESTDLHLVEPEMIDGIPTTPAGRLAVDLGAVISFARFDRAVGDLVRQKRVTWQELLEEVFRHSRKGRNGVGVLRALLKERYGEDVGESELERAFLRELRRRGLSDPTAQHVVRDLDGFIARVDFAYPALRIAIELDGRRFHDDIVFEADRHKRDRLVAAGWVVLEITWRMLVDHPEQVFRRIERTVAVRSEQAA
jgi:very-short-patch-repair endonuclease